jgi:hypothetical protein
MSNSKTTQNQRVLNHLKNHGAITAHDAVKDYGIYRLAARIWDLRDAGHDIDTTNISVKNRYGETVTVAKYILNGKND